MKKATVVKVVTVVTVVMLAALFTVIVAGAAEPSNPSPALSQPVGATRWFSPFELENGLRYRILVEKDGRIVFALDASRIDSLEWAGGDGGAGGGDAGASGDNGGNGGNGDGCGSR